MKDKIVITIMGCVSIASIVAILEVALKSL